MSLIEERAGNARRAADVDLVGVVEDLRLDALRRVALAKAMCAHAFCYATGKIFIKTVLDEKLFRLFRPQRSVTDALIAQLIAPGDVVEQTGGNDDIHIGLRLTGGNVQRDAKHAVDVLAVVRAVRAAHAFVHVGVQKIIPLPIHAPAP